MLTYYKALINDTAFRNWKDGIYFGYHNYPSPDWEVIWKKTKSINPIDYSLNCRNGIFTERARLAFIEFYPKLEIGKVLSIDKLRKLSELDGVFAFNNPNSALEWGLNSKIEFYVEFEGDYLANASEINGVIARVVTIVSNIFTRNEFVKRHNLVES